MTKISNLGNAHCTKLNQRKKYAYEKLHRVFDELQVAREALRACCDDFSVESRITGFKSKSKSAKRRANEKMQQCLESNFEDVVAIVYGLESEWKQKHSNVRLFRNIALILSAANELSN